MNRMLNDVSLVLSYFSKCLKDYDFSVCKLISLNNDVPLQYNNIKYEFPRTSKITETGFNKYCMYMS